MLFVIFNVSLCFLGLFGLFFPIARQKKVRGILGCLQLKNPLYAKSVFIFFGMDELTTIFLLST